MLELICSQRSKARKIIYTLVLRLIGYKLIHRRLFRIVKRVARFFLNSIWSTIKIQHCKASSMFANILVFSRSIANLLYIPVIWPMLRHYILCVPQLALVYRVVKPQIVCKLVRVTRQSSICSYTQIIHWFLN